MKGSSSSQHGSRGVRTIQNLGRSDRILGSPQFEWLIAKLATITISPYFQWLADPNATGNVVERRQRGRLFFPDPPVLPIES